MSLQSLLTVVLSVFTLLATIAGIKHRRTLGAGLIRQACKILYSKSSTLRSGILISFTYNYQASRTVLPNINHIETTELENVAFETNRHLLTRSDLEWQYDDPFEASLIERAAWDLELENQSW